MCNLEAGLLLLHQPGQEADLAGDRRILLDGFGGLKAG